MKTREFLNKLDEEKIVAAIGEAERKTSGEIRIFVSRQNVADAMSEARHQFTKLGMEKTRERNGILLFFAPLTQQFAVIGDTGIHEKCGAELWQKVVAQMENRLRENHFNRAVIECVREVGAALSHHFPRRPDDQNELPDHIVKG